jgi:hypothetical protein
MADTDEGEPFRPPVRASQAERDEAVAELRERFVAGHLSQDTFVYRMEAALTARDRRQLAELFADLPGVRRLRLPRWRELPARLAAGTRARAAVASVRHALTASARRPPIVLASRPADLLFPAGSQPRFTIGRHPDCDLVIPDITVSRWHAGLAHDSHGWLLTDLGSTNGTRLNGWRVRTPVPVGPGDQVSFGAVTFVLRPGS